MKKLKTDNVSNEVIIQEQTMELLAKLEGIGESIKLVHKNINYVINILCGDILDEQTQQSILEDLTECNDILAYEYISKF